MRFFDEVFAETVGENTLPFRLPLLNFTCWGLGCHMQKKLIVSQAALAAAVLVVFSDAAAAEKTAHAAKIIVLQGQVFKKPLGAKTESPAKKDELLNEGTTLVTKDRSFVKLLFTDNTQMNLGPNSSMQIQKYKANEAGMIQLIDGKLRAKVQKDLLSKEQEKKDNKLFINTKTAAMGVRGTDFQVTYSRQNEMTSLVTFESEVAMVKFDAAAAAREGRSVASGRDSVIDNVARQMADALASKDAVVVGEGQFSAAGSRQDAASEPVRISPEQLESLRKNETFATPGEAGAGGSTGANFKSPIPPGVNAQTFATTAALGSIVKTIVASAGTTTGGGAAASGNTAAAAGAERAANAMIAEASRAAAAAAPESAKSGVVEGGYVDLSKGVYVAPDPNAGAIFDPVTKLFIPDPSIKIAAGGSLELAAGVTIASDGTVTRPPETLAGAPPPPLAGTDATRSPAGATTDSGSSSSEDLNDQDEADEEQELDDQKTTTQTATSTDVTFQITTP